MTTWAVMDFKVECSLQMAEFCLPTPHQLGCQNKTTCHVLPCRRLRLIPRAEDLPLPYCNGKVTYCAFPDLLELFYSASLDSELCVCIFLVLFFALLLLSLPALSIAVMGNSTFLGPYPQSINFVCRSISPHTHMLKPRSTELSCKSCPSF